MDIVLDIVDELVLDRLYAAALPLSVFLPKVAANVTASSIPQPAPSLWSSVVSSLPHPPVTHAADAATKLAAHSSSLPTWLLRWGSPAVAASAWPRDYIPRQMLSLSVITLIGIHVLYFVFAALSYYLIFDHDMMKHPKFLKVSRVEITSVCGSLTVYSEPSQAGDSMCTECIPWNDCAHSSLVLGTF
jgi:lathosterol oxidase